MLFHFKNDNDLGKIYESGAIVFRQGDPADCLYFILEGQVEMVAEVLEIGRISMEVLKKDDIFGATSFFCQSPRVLTARALGEARLLTIDQKGFFQKVSKDPALASQILLKMADSSHRLIEKIIELKVKQTHLS